MLKDVFLPSIPIDDDLDSQNYRTSVLEVLKTLRSDVYNEFDTSTWADVVYENSWEDYGTSRHGVSYIKDAFSFVRFRGSCKNGSSGVAFTLPSGYRPEKEIYTSLVTSGNTAGVMGVDTDGVVTFYNYSNTWVSLDGVSFQV